MNYASDDYVLRIQNLSPTKSTSFKISDIFDPKYFLVTSIREKSLNLVYDVPHGKSILDFRTKWNEGEHTLFDFTSKVEKAGSDDSQNTEEEGVFLSTAAIEEKSTGGRRVLSLVEKKDFTLNPGSIGSYLISIELVNNHRGVLVVTDNDKKEDKEEEEEHHPNENEKDKDTKKDNEKEDDDKTKVDDEKEDDDDLINAIKGQHEIPKNNVGAPPGTIFEKPTTGNDKWNVLLIVFFFIVLALSFCCYFICRKKVESAVLPLTKNEVKDQ